MQISVENSRCSEQSRLITLAIMESKETEIICRENSSDVIAGTGLK